MIAYIIALVVTLAFFGIIYFFFIRDTGSVYEKAIMLAERGDYTDARGLIRARIDSDPDNVRAHYIMSRIYNMEGNEDSELVHLLELKRINRWSPDIQPARILARIAEIYYIWGAYRDSYENFLEVIGNQPSHDTALAFLAFMALGQQQFDIAEGHLRRLVKVAPNVPDYRLARGIGLAMQKSSEALPELELALAMNPHDESTQFMVALQAYRQNDAEKARTVLNDLIPRLMDPAISYIASKLATVVCYMLKDYPAALSHAERCLHGAIQEGWNQEEYDSRLSVAYMALLTNNMEKANEHLLELEIRNPADQTVMKVSDFRMDIEEGIATVDVVSPRGFDFLSHLQDWARRRFPPNAIYDLSGLKMEAEFDLLAFHTSDGSKPRKSGQESIDPAEYIARFNALKGTAFQEACERLITILGHKVNKALPYRDKDGADYLTVSQADKKVRALFKIRQWKNQPISDIFLRDLQNNMNELKVQEGYVVAGARLTPGAENALQNLKKINVVNDLEFAELLLKVLRK